MAPVAYCLWQRFLRFDPERPDLAEPRPLRALGRPRLDAALLAAAPDRREGGQSRSTRRSASRRSRSTTSSSSASSTADAPATPSTAGPRASRRRPARSARAWRPASAWRSPRRWLAQLLQPARLRAVRLRRLRALRRRLHDGRHLRRGRVARRPPASSSNLCWIYDNNHITIEGNTALAFSEDVATRFIGYGWNVTRVGDANDLEMLERAFTTFKNTTDRPTLIIVDSHIGYGAPNKQDTSAAHGEPLGEEEIRLTKRHYGWPEDAQVPRARRRARALRGGHRRARRRSCATPGWRKFEEYQRAVSRAGRPALPDAAPRAARRLGHGPADVPGRRQGPGDARRLGQGAERDRARTSLADRRLGRPRARRPRRG